MQRQQLMGGSQSSFDEYLRGDFKQMKELSLLTLEEQSSYADQVAFHYIEKEDTAFSRGQFESCKATTKEQFYQWNSTSIGNIAIFALRDPIEEQRPLWKKILEDFTAWIRDEADEDTYVEEMNRKYKK